MTALANDGFGMPRNAATGRAYSGINVLILWGAVVQHGFPGQTWLTFRQALTLGGNVRRGERGVTVVYADRFVPDDEKRRAREAGEDAQAIPFLKRFTVFNTTQCEGLPASLAVEVPAPAPGLIEPRVEARIQATGVDIRPETLARLGEIPNVVGCSKMRPAMSPALRAGSSLGGRISFSCPGTTTLAFSSAWPEGMARFRS